MDDKDQVYQKVKRAKTDSGSEISFDPINKPNIANLLFLFSLVTNKKIDVLENEYRRSGYKSFKDDLSESISNFLEPIQNRRSQLGDEETWNVIVEGTHKARIEGKKTIKEVRRAMKLVNL